LRFSFRALHPREVLVRDSFVARRIPPNVVELRGAVHYDAALPPFTMNSDKPNDKPFTPAARGAVAPPQSKSRAKK